MRHKWNYKWNVIWKPKNNSIKDFKTLKFLDSWYVLNNNIPFIWALYKWNIDWYKSKWYILWFNTVINKQLTTISFQVMWDENQNDSIIEEKLYSNIYLFDEIIKSFKISKNIWENNSNYELFIWNTFTHSNWDYKWAVKVKGFIEFSTMKEPFCEKNCKTFKYLFFNIIESGNKNLLNFLDEYKWPFIWNNKIWIGCLNDSNIISYYNYSDEDWEKEYYVKLQLSEKIIKSNKDSPIIISLYKPVLTWWKWAPACYSYFRIIGD